MRASVLALAGLLLAGPATAHDWFDGLLSPDGLPCCGQHDCRAVPYRRNLTTGQDEIEVNGRWRPVDPRKVSASPTPDGKVYACWYLRPKAPHSKTPQPASRDDLIIRCIILPRMSSLETSATA